MSKIVVSIMSMSALEDYQEILALLQMMNSPVHQQAISSVHDILPSISSVANYSPISQKYPFVYRDLAALLKKNIAIGVEGEARINFLANHCSYFLNNRLHAVPSLGVKWLTATDQLLRSGGIPLINLLRYHAYEYPLDSPKFSLLEYTPAQIEELNHLYSIVSASKKLEYRIMSMQTELRRMEDRAWHDITLHDQGYSLNRIIKFFTDKSTVISLLSGCLDQTQHINRSEESMDIVVEQKGMTGIISALSLYGTLLMCAPTGLDSYPPDSSDSMEVVHAKVSAYSNYITHDVIGDILNTMAFSFPSVPLVTKLWCLLKTEFASIISVVVDQDMDVCLRSAEFKELAANLEVSIDDLYHAFHCTLFMICSVMSYQLVAIDDQELLVYCKILPLDDIVELMMLLKRWLYKLYWTYPVVDTTMHFLEVQPGCSRNHLVVLHCQYAATKLFNSMCYRNERRKFIDTEDLYWSGVSAFDLAIVENEEAANNKNDSPIESGDTFSFKNLKAKAILTFLPQVTVRYHYNKQS